MNYLLLFSDCLISALAFFIRSESVIYALIIFGKNNSHLIFITALFGSVLGSLINWFIGNKLQILKRSNLLKNKAKEIENAQTKWNKYLIWLLLFSPLKIIGNPLSLLAGFLNSSFKKFLAIIFFSKFIYYFWLIYYSDLVV